MTPKLVPYWVCDRTPSSGWMIFFSAALVLGETNLYMWMLGPRFQLRTSSLTSNQSQLAVTCFLPQSNSLNFILFYSENTQHCQDLRASLLVSRSGLIIPAEWRGQLYQKVHVKQIQPLVCCHLHEHSHIWRRFTPCEPSGTSATCGKESWYKIPADSLNIQITPR